MIKELARLKHEDEVLVKEISHRKLCDVVTDFFASYVHPDVYGDCEKAKRRILSAAVAIQHAKEKAHRLEDAHAIVRADNLLNEIAAEAKTAKRKRSR